MEIALQQADLMPRPVQTTGWRVPASVELEGHRLRWREVDGDRLGRVIRVKPGLVEAFMRLADADPEDIRDFARRWGVLMICEHGIPAGHSWPRVPLTDALNGAEKSHWCAPLGWPEACWEPIGAWYVLAQQARAMLNVAAACHRGMPARRGDWHTVVYGTWHGNDVGDPSLDVLNKPQHATSARAFLEDSVNRWLAWGAVQPKLDWSAKKDPMIAFDGFGLFGALAAQLLAMVSRTGWAVCSGCAQSYGPKRTPNPKRRNYCPDCRARRVPHRDTMRDLRRRKENSR
jgi:hypothetical protein